MAITAGRELLQHTGRMGYAVARLARWYVLVLVLMTIGARKLVVFGLIRLEQGCGLLMACAAIMGRYVIRVGHHRGHVNRMARFTGCEIHILGMFFVAFHTIGDQLVG